MKRTPIKRKTALRALHDPFARGTMKQFTEALNAGMTLRGIPISYAVKRKRAGN